MVTPDLRFVISSGHQLVCDHHQEFVSSGHPDLFLSEVVSTDHNQEIKKWVMLGNDQGCARGDSNGKHQSQ